MKVGFSRLDSDSVAKRGGKRHHRPTRRLRFVPPKKNRPPMGESSAGPFPPLAAGCTTGSCAPVGAHTLTLWGRVPSLHLCFVLFQAEAILLCSYYKTIRRAFPLRGGAGSLFTLVRGRGILRTSPSRSSKKFARNELSEVEAVATSGVVWLTTATLQDHQPHRERDPYRGARDGEAGDDVAHVGG